MTEKEREEQHYYINYSIDMAGLMKKILPKAVSKNVQKRVV